MIRRAYLTLFILLHTAVPFGAHANHGTDTVNVSGGAVLTGRILGVQEGKLELETAYAGLLRIDLSQVERVSTEQLPPADLPVALIERQPAAPVQGTAAPKAISASGEEVARNRWILETGLNLTGSEGNTDKFDVAFTVDAMLEHDDDRLDLYGRYAYGTNRGNLTADEVILGGRYSNYLFDGFGLFFREELERDDFEGILLRSTTASGFTWRIQRERDLTVEARSGLSYRYEDYVDDGSEDFPGLDFGLDVNWRFVQWMRFRGSYTYLPSARNFDDYILEQDSGFNLPLDVSDMWKLRFGVSSKYNSRPDEGRENLDHRYYARLIATWN
jgi:putative salt-induced outer membrane protein YdiY